MTTKRRTEPEKPKVERVAIVDKESGTVCTVGSDVVEKYTTGRRAQFVLESEYEAPEDNEVNNDPAGTPRQEMPPAAPEKAAPGKAASVTK